MRYTQGTSLIEVLLSLTLLAWGLLSYATLTIQAQQTARANFYFHRAAFEINNIYQELQLATNEYEMENIRVNYQNNIKETLPRPTVTIQGIYPHYRVAIAWGGYNSACPSIKISTVGCIYANLYL